VRRGGQTAADLIDDDDEVPVGIERASGPTYTCSMILLVPEYQVGIRMALSVAASSRPNVA
jgi:hypothetical protein